MVKEVRWSVKADRDRLNILQYWVNRNKSAAYSIRLARLLADKVDQLAQHPELGLPTDTPFIRVKMVENYAIYYNIAPDHIRILAIWDTRRNPQKLRL